VPLQAPLLPGPRPFLFGTTFPATRLRRYRAWISRGWALDLNDAVRLNSQLNRLARQAEKERAPYEWRHRREVKTSRRHTHHRRIILTVAKSCTFCNSPATDIMRLVPSDEGGKDVLRNKIPVCDLCRDLWPGIYKEMPQRMRRKLVSTLPYERFA
jgi:hypothetical protein